MEYNWDIILENNENHKTFFYNKKDILINKRNIAPALFLDRDGIIIEDCHYIKNPHDVKIMKGAKHLINYFKKLGWKVIIITNQSGIERGFFVWKDYEKVNNKMIELLNLESKIDAIYANGCGPNSRLSNWRKPNPDMLFEAKDDFNIDLEGSILIGDRLSDLKAGYKAGIKSIIQPGGSLKDDLVIKEVDEKKLSMVFSFKRSFSH